MKKRVGVVEGTEDNGRIIRDLLTQLRLTTSNSRTGTHIIEAESENLPRSSFVQSAASVRHRFWGDELVPVTTAVMVPLSVRPGM